jgi:hypothetical protein
MRKAPLRAMQQRIGRFEVANGGTIFLDEIAEVPEIRWRFCRSKKNRKALAMPQSCARRCGNNKISRDVGEGRADLFSTDVPDHVPLCASLRLFRRWQSFRALLGRTKEI